MNNSIKRFSLDIHEPHSSVRLDVKRGDTNSRTLLITLSESGLPYQITPECYAVFTATKPDGNIVFNHCTIEDNTIIYILTPQTVAVEGRLECEIKLYGADDTLITSPCFDIIVRDTVYNEGDEIESEQEVDTLTHLISEAVTVMAEGKEVNQESKDLITDLETKQEELNQKVENARDSANVAYEYSQSALRSKEAADTSADQASAFASNAGTNALASDASRMAAETHENNARTYAETAEGHKTAAAESAESAKEWEAKAKQHSDTIDSELIQASIDTKADDLYFDPTTNLLYLVSNGNIIGTGVQVATTGGGGGGGALTYAISMGNLLDSRFITVSEGSKVELKFSYASVDEDGIDDGPGIGRIIVGNATKHTFTVKQGDNVQDVTPFLTAGSNTVKIQVENSEGTNKTLPYVITVAAAYMTSEFDASVPFTGDMTFIYTPTGIAEKTVHFELDGKEIGTAIVTTSGRQQSYTIPSQDHGAHRLRSWFECEIEGTTVRSNVVSFAIICIEEGNTDPIIAVSNELPSSVEQYTNIVTKYRVYDPTGLTTAITLEADGEVVSNLTVDRTEQTWTYRPTTVGNLTQVIRCGEKYVSWTQTVTESTVKVEAETEALALHLSSYGRSNNEENPGVWKYGDISAQFQNFNFVSDGWLMDEDDNTVLRVTGDARLTIPYKMFASDFRTTGKTIEFELATREVMNYDAEVVNCYSGDRGFIITAQQLQLASEQSKIDARYKEDEHLRVTFVVRKKSGNGLIQCYINGIMSGATPYPAGDDFSQVDPVGITIGSNQCTTDIYNIRVYDNDLTRFQVLENWIADTQNPDERMNRYLRNCIYDAYGRVVISKLPTDLCYMVIECAALPQFKSDKKICSGYFKDLVHPERSFTFRNAVIDVQGTSSQYYWRKNYKIEFEGGFILLDGSTVTVYSMNEDAVPVSAFTMKADVASSEGFYNVVTAKLYNQYHPFKMPSQEVDPRMRYSIDGFPIVIFWDNGTETKFMGKYNFNNDKETPEPFGLSNGDERWEVLQNGTDRVGFHSADFSDESWKEDFKGNYPAKNTDLTNLQPMCEWVTSTETDPEKFSAELADHFIEDAVIYYYVFTEAFLCMDQREKNVLWRYIKALERWLADYYDADSIIGHNNQAQPVFDYWMEDIDHTASGDPVYNGQNSTFWKNLRETRFEDIKAEWHRLRDAGFNYESVMAAFEEHKSVWPEAIYNEDMQAKCLDPLEQDGDGNYLDFLRGDKWAWTQQWVYKRFRYLDSKYEYGTSLENRATIRTNVMENLTLTYYMKMYGHVYYNDEHVMERVEKDVECEFESHATGAEDRVIGINDVDMIRSLGDLSSHQVELIDLSKMKHLEVLKLGDASEDYVNNALTSVTFGNNIRLRIVILSNCAALAQALNLSDCPNIEEVYLDGTSVTGVSLPNGGILKKLHLPGTVTNLTLCNQKALTEFVMPSYANIATLRLENNSNVIDPLAILNAMPANSRVRIIGFNKTVASADEIHDFYDKLDTMRGLDENDNNVDKAQVSGTIHIDSITSEDLYYIKSRYPSINVTYNTIVLYTVRFWNGDVLLQTLTDMDYNSTAVYTGETPVMSGVVNPEDYIFAGWTPEPVVKGDMDFYAAYLFIGSYTRGLIDGALTGEIENDRVDVIEDYAFYGVKGITDVSFPEVTAIGESAFESCSGLTSIYFPKVTTVGANAFSKCGSLTEVILPSAISIGAQSKLYAFNQCGSLTKVDLGAATTIGNASFTGCGKLNTLIIRTNSKCVIYNDNVLQNTGISGGTGHIYVPSALVDVYRSDEIWSKFANQFRTIEGYPEICGGDE